MSDKKPADSLRRRRSRHPVVPADRARGRRDSPIVGAESAEAGLRAYRETGADAVIVDLMMEEVDSGTALVRDLLALGSRAPIFMLSSVGDSLNLLTDYHPAGSRRCLPEAAGEGATAHRARAALAEARPA